MADGVITFLLQNLSRLLVEEVNLLSGVKDKITALNNELKFIDVFLKSSEGKRNDKLVKEVVSQITDVAHQAEDVVDTYIADVTMQKNRNIVKKLFHGKGHMMMLRNVNAEIEKIKGTIDEIYKNKDRYGIEEGEFRSEVVEAAESLRKRRGDVEEEEVVGLVHDSSFVIEQLMEMDPRRNVVSIIGMGGLGKTTLARKIYNDTRVKKSFPCRAWGYVSNDYRAKELLLSLLKCLLSTSQYNDLFKKKEDEAEDDKPTISEEQRLMNKVRECLNGKRYLVVLDDIWKAEVWEEAQDAFPDGKKGSRILITSRIKEVASYTGTNPPYYLPFLSKEESWELFSKKVFRGEECPSDLQPLGRSIVESCGGLPLAIVVLAGLVARKEKSQREWLRIKGHVNWHLAQDKTKVMDVLKLSYDSLPQRLRPCFLYFGIYPEDYEIPVRQLIQLWIAEGLIQPQEIGISNAPEPEDVADDYLDELVDRSLVQVASKRSDGGVKTCRIHDLLRDLCISESKADKFLVVCTELNIHTLCNPRRLSLHCTPQFYMSSTKCNHSCTRSLFVFAKEFYPDYMMEWITKNFKLARVVDFHQENLRSLPSDMKRMIHLRCLRIDTHYVEVIPASICSLWNLETLDLRNSYIKEFPSKIWKLKRLRHIYTKMMRLPDLSGAADSETMWNLQTLSTVALDLRTASLVNNGRFPKLRKFGLCKYYNCSPSELLQSLHHLSNLHTLKIKGTSELPSLANVFPSNLAKITLTNIELFDLSCMNTLGRLTNLQVLKIIGDENFHPNSFDLICATAEFPQLQVFQMERMSVKTWRLEKGVMPHLRRLVIDRCEYLIELPEGLWSLTTLREVQALWPSTELENSLQNVELKSGCKLIIYPPPTKEESNSVSMVN